jgi:hypothetical protein
MTLKDRSRFGKMMWIHADPDQQHKQRDNKMENTKLRSASINTLMYLINSSMMEGKTKSSVAIRHWRLNSSSGGISPGSDTPSAECHNSPHYTAVFLSEKGPPKG